MSSEPKPRPIPTVFLSYASEDRAAAQILRDALPAYGLEVWYDESALHGGDAWDQKIRNQIRDCDFFMPVISAQTEARSEGYFRREWRLAVDRSHDMADDHLFLLPVVIDETAQASARVPEKFLSVQWSRLPGGKPTPAFEAVCRRLASGEPAAAPKRADRAGTRRRSPREMPPFPAQEPGQKLKYFFAVAGWCLRSAWALFTRLPRWVRILVYVWVAILLLSKGCESPSHTRKLSSDESAKVKQIADTYKGGWTPENIAKLGAQIQQVVGDEEKASHQSTIVLAIPFTAPSGDSAAEQVADSTFAQVFGRVSIAHHGRASLPEQPVSNLDPVTVLERGRAEHAKYVVYGYVDGKAPNQLLKVKLLEVEDGALTWSQDYPLNQADAAKIVTDLNSNIDKSD